MKQDLSPTGWAVSLTKLLDAAYPEDELRYPVDVEKLALQYSQQRFPDQPIRQVIADDTLEGCDGALIRGKKEPPRWGILYNSAHSPGRVRFTIAHEFAHYLLHRAKLPDGIRCGEDVVTQRNGIGIEKEADTFAAFLLMPFHDFRARIPADRKPTLDELSQAATRYGVSLTAAVLRWLEYTQRRSVFVVSREGYALWAKASDPAFKSGIFIRTKTTPPFELPRGAAGADGGVRLESRVELSHPAGIWFNEPVEELTILSEEHDIVLTLLHLGKRQWVDQDETPEEDTYDHFMRQQR
jgi:hypothetical protein